MGFENSTMESGDDMLGVGVDARIKNLGEGCGVWEGEEGPSDEFYE